MKYKILLFGIMAAVLTGCASTYKAGQTPDDVYYSPAREGASRRKQETRTGMKTMQRQTKTAIFE
jgi:hypothetical protein